jgi:hypothetical protein
MRHWEKNKKDFRRFEESDFRQPSSQDHKKKKLKPLEKTKYRAKSYNEQEE